MKHLLIPCNPGQVSDGYHTFDELYDHRCTLFVALMAAHPQLSWMSTKHDDGSMFDGWFICGMDLPTGTVTYHLPAQMIGLAQDTGAKVLPSAPKWDGHTPADVVARIREFVRSKSNAAPHGRDERSVP